MPLDQLPLPDASAANSAPVAPAAAPAAALAAEQGPLPSPFLDVVQGKLPAVVLPPISKGTNPPPEVSFAVQNFDTLLKAGLDYYETKHSDTVLFNPKLLTEDQVKAAEKAGKLQELTKPVEAAPALAEAAPAAAAAPVAAPAAVAAAPAPSKPAQRARLAALTPPSAKGGAIKPNPIPDKLAKRAI